MPCSQPQAASFPSSGVVVCSKWMSSLEVSVGGEMSPLRAQLLDFACSKNYVEPRDSKLAPATQRKSYHMWVYSVFMIVLST